MVVKIVNRNSFSMVRPSCPSGCMEVISCFKMRNRYSSKFSSDEENMARVISLNWRLFSATYTMLFVLM